MKENFSVKLQTENRCFCLRQKCNKAQAAQIRNTMQSSSTLTKISGPIAEVKKAELIKDSEKSFAYWKESKQRETLVNKLGLFRYSWWVWEAAQPQQTKLLYK